MRACGYYSFDSLSYAIFEANGNLSVLGNENASQELPILLVNCGKIIKNNYTLAKLDESFNDVIFKEQNIKSVKDVVVMTVDGTGKVYLQEKDKKYVTFQVELPKGVKW